MADDARHSIEEVARLSGSNVRTIRYYIERGLIARPLGRGRGKHFSDLHVRQMKRIFQLKAVGIGLGNFNASPEELARVLEERGIDIAHVERLLGEADVRAAKFRNQLRGWESGRAQLPDAAGEAIRLKIDDGIELRIAPDRDLPPARKLAELAIEIRKVFGPAPQSKKGTKK